MKPRIFYKFYSAGLINQTMSLEIAAGIHYKTNRPIILHNLSSNYAGFGERENPIHSPSTYCKIYSDLVSVNQYIRIDDIMSWQGKENFTFVNDEVDTLDNIQKIERLQLKALVDYETNSKDLELFLGHRESFILPQNEVHLTNTLNWYSRFFYHRDKDFDLKMKTVRFNQEYYDLAIKIAESLGKFNGVHLRLTDHIPNMYEVQLKLFEDAIDTFDKSLITVIATDDPKHEILSNTKHKFILLGEYIYENFFNEFKQLPFTDDVIFGLINNLVMHYSQDFIGTQGSTYSGYIQRCRINNGLPASWKMFEDLDYKPLGKYSWIGYNIDELAKSWWREWEESKFL
jgi:hypothetical protein